MPELPEVETIKQGLTKVLIGHRVKSIEVRAPKMFVGFPEMLEGQKLTEIERRAKLLILKFETCYAVIHLKLTGQLIFVPTKSDHWVVGGHPDVAYTADLPHRYTQMIFEFDNGTLYFNDLRKFGWVKVINDAAALKVLVAEFGPEYDWSEFNLAYFTAQLTRRKNLTIKQSLLDQTLVAGIGNIYADETLFCALVHPRQKNSELTPKQIEAIFECIPKIFKKSLEHGGTSSQHYRKADGSMGTFLTVANVYKREGLPCRVCGTPIERIKIAGRSSRFCPNCQPVQNSTQPALI